MAPHPFLVEESGLKNVVSLEMDMAIDRTITVQETVQVICVTRSKAEGVVQHFWLQIDNVPTSSPPGAVIPLSRAVKHVPRSLSASI